MNVNRYDFDRIIPKTKQMISPIRRGEEDGIYFEYLALLEMKLHQFHLKYGINGRQAKEILKLSLFDIKSITEHKEYDCFKFEEDCYRECADLIGQFYLPEKNAELKDALRQPFVADDDFFEFARKNIIRIHESVEQWTKDFGPVGYFNFIGNFLASEIKSTKKFLVEDRYLKA